MEKQGWNWNLESFTCYFNSSFSKIVEISEINKSKYEHLLDLSGENVVFIFPTFQYFQNISY